MATLTRLPPEVLQQILLHVHDGFQRHPLGGYHPPLGRYELKAMNYRANLSSLRSVNWLFHQLVTPLLFQHALISGGSGVKRLQQLSKNASLRRLVRRLEICVEVRPVTGFDAYSANLKMNEDKNLSYLGRLAIVIHSTLPRFSDLEILKLDLVDIPYQFQGDYDDLSSLSWEQDTANLFESLATAMRTSQLDKLDEVDLSLPLAYDFGHFLNNDTDDSHDTKRYPIEALFQRLKYLRLHCGQSTDDGEGIEFRHRQPNEEYNKYIRQLLPLAPNIHSLTLEGSDRLMLDKSELAPLRLRTLNLESLSIAGNAFTVLIQQSTALNDVILRGVYLESGMWKEILLAMSQSPITSFYIETCGYQMEGESAHFRPLDPGSRPSDSYIETTETDDLDACEAVFTRLRENKRQIYGSNYDEAADIERRIVELRETEIKLEMLNEYLRGRFAAEVSEDDSSDAEITDTEASDSE
ncbi:hypothetical protein B0J13DRAFT_596110 [Dactylonectria estremocensis]|uniref:F-box domain-containing protein n=1 Tax=Dactylonectria estremocensis TaxID=1079267 RepID=A0A9P9ERX2_9HYPO|nr:hypothetical protein B0J13DRAFT_596110 [Dactylonectria estremocensis]